MTTYNPDLQKTITNCLALMELFDTAPEHFTEADKKFAGTLTLKMIKDIAQSGMLSLADEGDELTTKMVLAYIREQFPETSALYPNE